MSNGSTGIEADSRTLAWAQVDVFAEAPHEGNQLAIFPDARGLSDGRMQRLARETNLSETTFILPREPQKEQEHGIRVRIFTTEEELPFAGHPTLGTASWLRSNRPELQGVAEIKLELNVGTIPVRFPPELTGPGLFAVMQQRDPSFGPVLPREPVAAALGLTVTGLHPDFAPQVVSTGLPFLIVTLRSVQASQRLSVSFQHLQALLDGSGAHFAYIIAPVEPGQGISGAAWHARMPLYGGEDPATGSAAGCAISYLLRHGAAASGVDTVIEQGIEILRPSRITAQATLDGDHVRGVLVAGRTISVASGHFFLP